MKQNENDDRAISWIMMEIVLDDSSKGVHKNNKHDFSIANLDYSSAKDNVHESVETEATSP